MKEYSNNNIKIKITSKSYQTYDIDIGGGPTPSSTTTVFAGLTFHEMSLLLLEGWFWKTLGNEIDLIYMTQIEEKP